MTSDPRAALDRLIAALEAHLQAAGRRHGEADPAVVAAYQTLADAFETYDEVTPFVLYDDAADEEEDEDDEAEDDEFEEIGDEDEDDVLAEEDDLEDDYEEEDEDDEAEDEEGGAVASEQTALTIDSEPSGHPVR